MAGLTIKNVSKTFGKQMVLDDISIELATGELLVLLGPSGCGKTTLLRLIAGLEQPDSGEVHLEDKRIDHLLPKDRKVAMVFQNYALYPHMSVEKNLAFPLKVSGVSRDEIAQSVASIAELLGLTEKLTDRPGQLSGGQRQRVALGRAIIRRPSLFLLDEPLSNLDADLRARMRLEIVRLQKDLKVTTVHVTHDQVEALTMGDRIALLHEGKLVQVGTPQELYQNPNCVFTARFIGTPRINIIDGTVKDGLMAPFGLPITDFYLKSKEAKIMVGLRPDDIELTPGGEFSGVVASCEYLGEQYVTKLLFDDTPIVVSGLKKPYGVGDVVKFSFDHKRLLFFNPDTERRIM